MIDIYLDNDMACADVQDYLTHSNVKFTHVETWDSSPAREKDLHDLPEEIFSSQDTAVVMAQANFFQMLSDDAYRARIHQYISRGNHMLVTGLAQGGIDSYYTWDYADPWIVDALKDLDHNLGNGSLTLYLDAQPMREHWLLQDLKNVKFMDVIHMRYWLPTIRGGRTDKKDCTHDFLLLTVYRDMEKSRHRKYLMDQLRSRPGLMDRGMVNYTTQDSKYDQWVGGTFKDDPWPDASPSMSLYLDSWMEVVPETMYARGHYVTEKTLKPMATRTPFLVCSTQGYLRYLQSQGYRTFGGLINERYDQEPDLATRISKMLDQLQDIVRNGAESFYRASQDILEHNQLKLAENHGMMNIRTGHQVQGWLDRING
jgi:hypothetical protein